MALDRQEQASGRTYRARDCLGGLADPRLAGRLHSRVKWLPVGSQVCTVRCALKEFGWVLHAGGSAFKVWATGEVMNLNFTSPRAVIRKAWEGWQDRLFRQEMARLDRRRRPVGDRSEHMWCQQLVRDIVHTKKFEGRARALSLFFFSLSLSPIGGRHGPHGVMVASAWMANARQL